MIMTTADTPGIKELSGKLFKGRDYWKYESYYLGDRFCHDFTDHVSGYRPLAYATPSWGGGVVDQGAQRMAIVMLVLALPLNGAWGVRSNANRIRNLYRQFAKEVVAHLPDNWSMSKAEILKWINKKEKKRRKKKKK